MSPALGRLGAALAGAAGVSAGAPGQPADVGAKAPPKAAAQAGAAFPIAARAMSRVAMLDMWQFPTLQPRDYRIASIMLEAGADLDPSDEDLLRRLIEAEDSAGRNDKVIEYTQRLVRLAKDDTVAQLRLITAGLASKQNVDERLATYDRFLGPQGSALDASIRSRLALDSAMLLRERGDLAACASRLSQAIALDPTNKEAAAAAVLFHAERTDDPAGQVDLLLVLLKADPLDPETAMALGRALASGGAYRAAQRMYRFTADMASAMGMPGDAGILAEMHVIGWCVDGARKKVITMKDGLDGERDRIIKERERLQKIPNFLGKLPDPHDAQFDVPTSRVLVAAASALDDTALADWAIAELALAVKTAVEAPKLVAAPAPGEKADPAQERARALTPEEQKQELADLLWMRLWSGRQLDQAEAQLKELRADPAVGPGALQRLEGWFALRKGDIEGARRILEPLSSTDPLAELGLGVAIEAEGQKDKAAPWYTAYYHRNAGSMAGAWARTRAGTILGDDPAPPADASRLETLIADIPSWLEGMVSSPRTFESLQADVLDLPSDRTFPVESYPIRIRIRNIAPIPLAVGAERPINSRFLLYPSAWLGKDRVDDTTSMEVVSLARRLRLAPQEAMDITIRADNGWLWRRISLAGNREVKLRWRAIQGFRLTADRIAVPGPLCLSAETSVMGRPAPPMSGKPVGVVRAAIESGTPDQAVQAIGDSVWRLLTPADRAEGGFTPAECDAIARAVAARYPTLDVSGRIILLALLPTAARQPAMAPVDEAVRQESDPVVLGFVLLTRITDPADPLLDAAISSGGAGAVPAAARLAELAGLLRDRLTAGEKGYAGLILDEAAKEAEAAKAAADKNAAKAPEKP